MKEPLNIERVIEEIETANSLRTALEKIETVKERLITKKDRNEEIGTAIKQINTAIFKLSNFIDGYHKGSGCCAITKKAKAISEKKIEKISPKDMSDITNQITLHDNQEYTWCQCVIWQRLCCDYARDYSGAFDVCSLDAQTAYLETFQDDVAANKEGAGDKIVLLDPQVVTAD